MNVLEVTNKVLKRLREDTVADTTETEYSALIAEFVADTHADCCDEHDWSSMKHYITVTLVPGQRTYNLGLTVSDDGDVPDVERVTKNDSHLVFDNQSNDPMAFLFDDGSDALGEQMLATDWSLLEYKYQTDRSLENELPCHFAYRLCPDNEGIEFTVWPLPSIAKTVRLQFWTPPEIVGDGEDDTTQLLMPWRPVYHGALMLALNERGEEIGEPGNIAERRYMRTLANYIEADTKLGVRTDQYEAWRD